MPIPSPKGKEKKSDFISRCISDVTMRKEYPDQSQRSAVCYTSWRKAKGIPEPKEKKQSEGDDMTEELFRGDISKGLSEGKAGVDRENGIIRGFAVISKGEAKGHGIEIDETSLDQVVEFGNQAKIGIKSRFGHPAMSSDALGTFLGRAKNFRKDGNVDRADLHIDKSAYETPNGNLADYVMTLAEEDPNAFGSSIVFEGKREPRLNNDSTVKKDKDGNEMLPLVRFTKLLGVDAVDNPAANKGMFGAQFFSDSVMPSAEMAKFLDKFLQDPSAIEKTVKFLQRYSAVKEDGGENLEKKTEEKEFEEELLAEKEENERKEKERLDTEEKEKVRLAKEKELAEQKEKDNEILKKGGKDMERIEKVEKGQEKLMRQATIGVVDKFMESHASQILPAFAPLLKTVLIETSLSESPEKVIAFTETGKDEVKLSIGEALQEIVCRLPNLVEFTEKAGIDPNSPIEKDKAEFQKIVTYAKDNKISVADAREQMEAEKNQE